MKLWLSIISVLAIASTSVAGQPPPGVSSITVDWGKVERVSRTTATLQVVVNPPLRRGSPIHDQAFRALKELGADHVRFVPWLPYPRLAVAELEPPAADRTSWDFTLIDPLVADFLAATAGRPAVLNFSTTPQWMWKTPAPVTYPADPDQVVWNYSQGNELRDPSAAELAAYYRRVAAWYTQGGFTDELGRVHRSDHHYPIAWWEVLNEPDLEHNLSAQQYTTIYDAVVAAVRTVTPQTKFVGASLAYPRRAPEFFEYFLDPRNHAPGTPLDMISYHFYATPSPDQSRETQGFTAFEEAEHFLTGVRFIETIRKRLSPSTGSMLNEVGMIADHLLGPDGRIPDYYWNLAGAVYGYLWSQLNDMGIEVAGESQLVGYPTQFPSVTMLDWKTGQPNARFRALELILRNFGPGDSLVSTRVDGGSVHARGFVTRDGQRRLFLVNKRDRNATVSIAGLQRAKLSCVDVTTKDIITSTPLSGPIVSLGPYAVAVVDLGSR